MLKKLVSLLLFVLATSAFAQSPYGRVLTLDPSGTQQWIDIMTVLSTYQTYHPSTPPTAWLTSGNLLSGGEFLGSTNNQPLIFKTNKTEQMRITPTGQIGIGTTSPNPSAILEIVSNTTGILIPRLTTAQRNAIGSPATGLLIYNTNTNSFDYYDGTSWQTITTATTTIVPFNSITSGTNTSANMVVGTGATFTTNDDAFTIQDNANNTKKAKFEASNITTGTTRTYTLPDASGEISVLGQSIGTSEIEDGAVTTAKIANGSSNYVLLTNSAGDAVQWGKITASNMTGGDYSSVITSGTYSINISGNAAHLAGGAAGDLPYQSGLNTTTFLTHPSNADRILTTTATGLQWVSSLTDAQVADNLTINNGTINNTPIGQTTPAAGTFTTLTATTSNLGTVASGTWNGSVIADAYIDNTLTITGGSIDGTVIGGTTPAAGTFTNLQVNGTLHDGNGTGTTGQVLAVASDGTPAWTTLSTLETDPQVGTFTADGQVARWNTSGNGNLEPGSLTDWNGTVTANGNFAVNGNTTLGDASNDNVTFNATVASNIVPDANATRNLGSASAVWNTVYTDRVTETAAGGFKLVYYPSEKKSYFDIYDQTTGKPIITLGPLSDANYYTGSQNGVIIVRDKENGNIRGGVGYDGSLYSWVMGVGDQDVPTAPKGVQLYYKPTEAENDPRIAVANGSTTPVFLVDREGDVTASSVTVTGNTTVNGNTTLGNANSDALTINATSTFAAAVNFPVTTVTSDATLGNTHFLVLVDATGGAVTITLPSASSNTGRMYVIMKIAGTADVTIQRSGNDNINGGTYLTISSQWGKYTVMSDGSNWVAWQ